MRRNDSILGDAAILSLALERRKKKGKSKRIQLDEAVISHLNLGVKAMDRLINLPPNSESSIEQALRVLRGSNLSQRDIVEGTGRITMPEAELAHRKTFRNAAYIYKRGEKKAHEEEQRILAEQAAYVPLEHDEEWPPAEEY